MSMLSRAAMIFIAMAPCLYASDGAPPPEPKVRLAQIVKEDVERAEIEVVRTEAVILKSIDEAISAMKIDKPEAEKAAMAGMKELASRGRKLGKAVLDGHADYAKATKSLKAVYNRAPATFRDAAGTFRNYATEEKFEEIKHDYLTCAVTWDTLATAMEKRVPAIEAEEKEIAGSLAFVERSVIFLERFEAFAAGYPDLPEAEQRAKFLNQLRRYLDAYEGLRGSLGKFHEQLKKQALAPDARRAAPESTFLARSESVNRTPAAHSIMPHPVKPNPPRAGATMVTSMPRPSMPQPVRPVTPVPRKKVTAEEFVNAATAYSNSVRPIPGQSSLPLPVRPANIPLMQPEPNQIARR